MIFNKERRNPQRIILLCLLLITHILNGQTYRFKNFGIESGIPNTFIYTLGQDNDGYLWVGTANGLSKFDGFTFHNIPYPDSLSGHYPTVNIKDSKGALWFGCNNGSVYYYEAAVLDKLPLPNTRFIEEIFEGPDGSVWIVPQGDALFRVDPLDRQKIKTYKIESSLALFSASMTSEGNILLGTQENILIMGVEKDTLIKINSVEGFDYSNVTAIHKLNTRDGLYIAGTNGNTLFKLEIADDTNTLIPLSDLEEFKSLNVSSIYEDSGGSLWISTNDIGFIYLDLSEEDVSVKSWKIFNRDSGLPGNNSRNVFQDVEGNMWFALFGDGLSMLNSLAFRFYIPGTEPETNNIIYVTESAERLFLGTPAGFYFYDPDNDIYESFTDLRKVTGGEDISSYYVHQEGDIWFGTTGSGLFVRDRTKRVKRVYLSGDSGKDYIKNITIDDQYIWLGSLNGVILLDRYTGALIAEYNITNGLPHNSIAQVFIGDKGLAAIATKTDRLYQIDPEKGVSSGKAVMPGTMNSITAFSQSMDGHMWAATEGYGLYELYGDSVRSYSRSDMLMSDYCYSVLSDSQDRIWIGHERGFSLYDRRTGTIKSYETDFALGGKCNPQGMFESSDGDIFLGTTEGLIIYDRDKDNPVDVPPFNNINYITINDTQYPYQSSFSLPYRKKYTIKVNYVGISLRDPEKVFYQTRLDNWDSDWSGWTTDREVILAPRDGRYRFEMVSVSDDEMTSEPVSFNLIIKKPFWRTLWFYFLSLAVVTLVVIIIVREREKAQKKLEQYLKKELDARTSEVMRQKDKIEMQNIEITDSINYAKRIQTSILPDFSKLKEAVKDAFIVFYPRDIVSGDFYWFDRLNEEKFILVCADSTGHGVPGAFMSMIGSTLLQDIILRQHITKPSKILKVLDDQIFSTLNQNLEMGVSNDGMDMTICEIDIRTRHIRFASAMRPVILVTQGESLYIKGNRCSIGGESVNEKFFDDQEYFLDEGDTIYLFSDGLPDQFGGPDGKKMKIARLKSLIEEGTHLPMTEQKDRIVHCYEEWKGTYDQVDDILLIGVRF